jgi:starch-binding outer membrane protein, SusD/RagB family
VLGIKDRRFWLFPLPYSDILSDPDVRQNDGY